MTAIPANTDAVTLANAIRTQKVTATAVLQDTLQRIETVNPQLNCFAKVLADRALAQAQEVDKAIARRAHVGFLTSVPFAVNESFNIAGMTTGARAKINLDRPPAPKDATAISRLKQAGAVLIGTLLQNESAYGFLTENNPPGTTRNPHDPSHSAGGGAAAVAAGLVPLSLGLDTNGSVCISASFCGVFGFKPTAGRLSRAGIDLLSSSLDQIGIVAGSVRDIAAVFDFLQGEDEEDPVCTRHPPEPALSQISLGIDGIRIAVADGYFRQGGEPQIFTAVMEIAKILKTNQLINLPESDRAAAAATLITTAEAAERHLKNLQTRIDKFDSASRDRLLAGALIPASWYIQSQRFRHWYREQVREVFRRVDLILAPTTPWAAPPLGQTPTTGETLSISPLGRFTQPLSLIGLPVLSIPVPNPQGLPLGLQMIAAPYNESLILRVGAYLERQGLVSVPLVNQVANFQSAPV